MKRSWFGAAVLVVLLALGLWVQRSSQDMHRPIVDALKAAQTAAGAGDWEKTENMVKEAEKSWHESMGIRAAVSDHCDLESINAGFACLKVWQQARDTAAVAALCAELASQVDALAEAQRLSWKNVL